MTIGSRLMRLLGMPLAKHLLVAEALLVLSAVSVAIALVPFRQLMALAGRSHSQMRHDDAMIAQCRWAVTAWADRVPWRAVCFQRGLALHLMLRRRGIASFLHYGIAQDQQKGMHAHVWISVDGRPVLGGVEAAAYACVATFPALPA